MASVYRRPLHRATPILLVLYLPGGPYDDCVCTWGTHWAAEAGMCLCPWAFSGLPHCTVKNGSLLSFNLLGNHPFPSSFGANLKGALNVGPRAVIKWSPVLLRQPLAPGLWAITIYRSWFHRSSSGCWGKKWQPLCKGNVPWVGGWLLIGLFFQPNYFCCC